MTLSQTATLTKQFIVIFVITIFVGIISFIGYRIWYANYLANLPIVEEQADIKFGTLPSPQFSKTTVSSSNFSYSIDTVTGGLPKVGIDAGFEKNIKVYFVTKTFATLLSPERAQSLAEKFAITTTPQIITETKYFYSMDDKSLNVDLDTGNFSYLKKVATPSAESAEDDNKLTSDFQKNLADLGVLNQSLSPGRSKVIKGETSLVQISILPNAIDNKPIMSAEFNKSLINAQVIKSADNLSSYISLNYTYYPIDASTFATYPLKTADQALDDLKFGKGSIVVEPARPQVSITSAYLAYFIGENYSPYLLPIYVFEGPQFVGFVSAIGEQFQAQSI